MKPTTLNDLFRASRALKMAAREYARALAWHLGDEATFEGDTATRLALAESALDDAAITFAAVKAARKVTP